MEYRPLGRTGMLVSPICLGNMMFGAWGNTDHDDCVKIVHEALDYGINFVDTADVYSAGESEVITGKALRGARRDGVILATKCHFPIDAGPFSTDRVPNTWGNSRRHIIKSCDDSLRRLGTDWIDLYQLHRVDPAVPVEETWGAMAELVSAGKVRFLGLSEATVDEIVAVSFERRAAAITIVVPMLRPETTPPAETVATSGFRLRQLTGLPSGLTATES